MTVHALSSISINIDRKWLEVLWCHLSLGLSSDLPCPILIGCGGCWPAQQSANPASFGVVMSWLSAGVRMPNQHHHMYMAANTVDYYYACLGDLAPAWVRFFISLLSCTASSASARNSLHCWPEYSYTLNVFIQPQVMLWVSTCQLSLHVEQLQRTHVRKIPSVTGTGLWELGGATSLQFTDSEVCNGCSSSGQDKCIEACMTY